MSHNEIEFNRLRNQIYGPKGRDVFKIPCECRQLFSALLGREIKTFVKLMVGSPKKNFDFSRKWFKDFRQSQMFSKCDGALFFQVDSIGWVGIYIYGLLHSLAFWSVGTLPLPQKSDDVQENEEFGEWYLDSKNEEFSESSLAKILGKKIVRVEVLVGREKRKNFTVPDQPGLKIQVEDGSEIVVIYEISQKLLYFGLADISEIDEGVMAKYKWVDALEIESIV